MNWRFPAFLAAMLLSTAAVAQPKPRHVVIGLAIPMTVTDGAMAAAEEMELQRLWMAETKTALFITHSVAEAAFLSERVLVMTPRPGRVAAEITVPFPRPRTLALLETAEFAALSGRLRRALDMAGHPA